MIKQVLLQKDSSNGKETKQKTFPEYNYTIPLLTEGRGTTIFVSLLCLSLPHLVLIQDSFNLNLFDAAVRLRTCKYVARDDIQWLQAKWEVSGAAG